MTEEVIIVERSGQALMDLVLAFRGTPYEITAVESDRPLQAATRVAPRHPAAIVVALEGTENVVEVRGMLDAAEPSRVLFLVPAMPPRPAMARIVNDRSGAILARGESPLVVVSTLVSLVAQRSGIEG